MWYALTAFEINPIPGKPDFLKTRLSDLIKKYYNKNIATCLPHKKKNTL